MLPFPEPSRDSVLGQHAMYPCLCYICFLSSPLAVLWKWHRICLQNCLVSHQELITGPSQRIQRNVECANVFSSHMSIGFTVFLSASLAKSTCRPLILPVEKWSRSHPPDMCSQSIIIITQPAGVWDTNSPPSCVS